MMDIGTAEWWVAMQEATEVGERICHTVDEMDRASAHVVQLLNDSSLLLEAGSHATAAFLAITSIEETAKINVSQFRRSTAALKRSKDPLFRHEKKHQLAMAPVLPIGTRLPEAISENRLSELINMGRAGGLVRSREASLYVERVSGALVVPRDAISFEFARELLLLAIEVFDDAIVGSTNDSISLGREADLLFAKWAWQARSPSP